MANPQFDVVVIGGGPGGYVAAIRAAQLGLSVACIESDAYADPRGEVRLGGTCLNVGCIPSKALLRSSELYEEAGHTFELHGISVADLKIDVAAMMRRKDAIVTQLASGIRGLFKKNKVALLSGRGSFAGRENERWQIAVSGADGGSAVVDAVHVVIATGSVARQLPGIPVDNRTICDNVGALALDAVPQRLGVIGAGAVGLELGSVWKRLGADVTVLEALPDFLAAADPAIAKEARKILTQKQGLKIHLGVKIAGVRQGKKGIAIDYAMGDETLRLECDKLIVAAGRVPCTQGLNAEAVGLKIDARGGIEVDEHCRTHLRNVWAVGDVVRGPMLAHKAAEEGVMVAERIAGQAGHVNYDAIPWVIYTHPEIAWVGKTETQLRNEGMEYRAGQVPFLANGRALGQGEASGFVKILACARTDRVLGVHIIGPSASELIAAAVTAIEFGASSEDIARICHAHPTLSEAMREAALAVDKRALHC